MMRLRKKFTRSQILEDNIRTHAATYPSTSVQWKVVFKCRLTRNRKDNILYSISDILQRTSMNPGQVKIQGVATCMFLCMDVCGLLYSTKDFHDECVFNESLEKDYYNVYFSSKYSVHDRTFYLAITKNGQPRKVEIKGKDGSLGKWSSNAAVLPQPVDHQTILDLENHMLKSSFAKNRHLRHHQLCPPPYHTKLTRNKNCRKEEKKSKRKKVADEKEDDEGKARKYEENDDTSTTNKRNRRRRKRPKLNEETVTVSAEADAADEENN